VHKQGVMRRQGSGILEIASKVGWKGRLLLSMLAVSARGPIREQIQGTKSTRKPPSLSLASPSPAPPPPAAAPCRGQARLCAPEP
jgi:hypothetical protein